MPGKILIVEDNGKNRELRVDLLEYYGYETIEAENGLGLVLAKKLVELHDGRMWVESDFGRESTFTFTVPTAGGICPA